MSAPRIILIWEHPFLRDSVKALLARANVQLLADYKPHVSLETIRAQKATHILVEAGSAEFQSTVTSLLEQVGITVIKLNLENNQLQVYQRQDYFINHPSDLINLLHNPPQPAS